MAVRLENDDSGFEALSGLPARPSYDFFRDKPGVKHLVGGRLDRLENTGEEQMQFLQGGNAFVWKRYMVDDTSRDQPFRIHWAVIDGDVHWYRF